ncbi:unnamed protein product [Phytomonas sp. Hart1]|nr:unnamed protein product [Phytomonas sp. Hart1]|eukprot:CCW66389.1 unnamed protein product [Phytomonas sp. isolate Hart1]
MDIDLQVWNTTCRKFFFRRSAVSFFAFSTMKKKDTTTIPRYMISNVTRIFGLNSSNLITLEGTYPTQNSDGTYICVHVIHPRYAVAFIQGDIIWL